VTAGRAGHSQRKELSHEPPFLLGSDLFDYDYDYEQEHEKNG